MYPIEFDATVLDGKIAIPAQYMPQFSATNNVKVILIKNESPSAVKKQSARNDDFGFGILSRYADTALWEQESKAWERAAIEKHEAN
jgi:hypothetical protein